MFRVTKRHAPKLDQRGYLRSGISDVGAFEFGGEPLRIASLTHLANGHFLLQGIGVPNAIHTIQASSDPSSGCFGGIGTLSADGFGVVRYDDADAVDLTRRFYRLSFP